MTSNQFSKALDESRETYADLAEGANKWAEERNAQSGTSSRWSWDCGYKLDYDGSIVGISSRFYPPHKNSGEGYNGKVYISIGEDIVEIREFNADTLDELAAEVEVYVAWVEFQIRIHVDLMLGKLKK